MSVSVKEANQKRAEWAGEAVRRFVKLTGTEPEEALTDLLCDLMHWADRDGFDFERELHRARRHYYDEIHEQEVG